jgi:tetratricopeptide (TPR) repeat protein/tRNA A-37 threonylcarbamoyl transferase component Bud32
MIATPADRDLLFGLIALQNNFVDQGELVAAFREWARDRSRPIERVLVDRGALADDERDLLSALVAKHVERHDGSAAGSLAALSSMASARESLRTVAEGDPELAASLNLAGAAKTQADDDDGDAFRTRYATEGDASADAPAPAATGLRFQRIRPHARGGLGEVFVAHDRELNREVALKEILDHHADNPSSRNRFLVEAEITGGLEHPGIVPVYGLGQYADGRPFYAMRFIEGDSLAEAITRFHNDEVLKRDPGEYALALQKLLRRFLDVCNAIAYAHSRRVLHRDLKPGNIMVGKYGETLVVDWGLAKALDRRDQEPASGERPLVPTSGSGSEKTLPGSAVGTPQYMSPEQAAGALDRLGPASDVYSLGATLYHLLAGRAPFFDPDMSDLLRRVQIGDFPPPRTHAPAVPKALEAICLKAMAVRPEDRYPTPLALAADIEHWLADEPVTALPDGWASRAARWGRRHRAATQAGAITLVSVAVVAVMAAVLINLWRNQADQARDQAERSLAAETAAKLKADEAARKETLAREDAQRAEARARLDAETARKTSEFLVGMFNATDPIGMGDLGFRAPGESSQNLKARTLLDRGAERIRAELKDRPIVQATLMDTIGEVYRSMALFNQARPLLETALEIRRAQKADDAELGDSLNHLAMLDKDTGRFERSERLFREAVAVRARAEDRGGRTAEAAESRFLLAWLLAEVGEAEEAEALFRRVIDDRAAAADIDRKVFQAHLGLAALLLDQARSAEAVPHIIASARNLLGGEKADLAIKAVGLFQAGFVAEESGQYAIAEYTLRQGLDVTRKALSDVHPYVCFFLYHLARTLESREKFAEAENKYRECLEVAKKTQMIGHPRSFKLVSDYARFLKDRGKAAEGRRIFEEAIVLLHERYGPGHLMTGEPIGLLGDFLRLIGDLDAAERSMREAHAIFEKSPGKQAIKAAQISNNLGNLLVDRRKFAEAETFIRRSIEVTGRTNHGDKGWGLAVMHDNLGRALAGLGRFDEAEREFLDAIDRYKALATRRKADYVVPLENFAAMDRDRGRFALALPRYREVLEQDRKQYGAKSQPVAADLEESAKLLVELDRAAEAVPLFAEATAIRGSRKDPDDPLMATCLRNEAFAHLVSGDLVGYRAARRRLLDRFAASKDARVLLDIAWTYAAAPDGGDDLAPLVARAEAGLDHKRNPAHRKVFGTLLYRAGRLDDAVRVLEEVRAASAIEEGFFLAMALHRLGSRDRAAEVFRESVERSDKRLAPAPGDPTRYAWDGRARVKLQRREAEALLEIKPG